VYCVYYDLCCYVVSSYIAPFCVASSHVMLFCIILFCTTLRRGVLHRVESYRIVMCVFVVLCCPQHSWVVLQYSIASSCRPDLSSLRLLVGVDDLTSLAFLPFPFLVSSSFPRLLTTLAHLASSIPPHLTSPLL
jgi:hypothetical protein